ncbi:hypothetical protein HMPREF0653_02837, partial [Prevotella disiens JCM 6334 = ATCC 29426]
EQSEKITPLRIANECKESLFSHCRGVVHHVPNNLRMVYLLGTE